jgi:UDP-N-acetylmuramoyl-L-alanyl-D-glutamate--2,6-diaminopimelate ligase
MMGHAATLDRLLAGLVPDAPALAVSDLALASRDLRAGGLFLACRGRRTHGLDHLADALARGARAVLWEPAPQLRVPEFPSDLYARPVPALRDRAGEIADRFFGAPSHAVTVIAVTGTNGKTTTAWLLAQALAACGRAARYAGTLGVGRPGALVPAAYTTPDAVTVHRELAALRDEGADCLAMEVSSHALDQSRVAGVRFHTAVFTNLTRDHLDYHGTMEAYGAAKARLFAWPGLALRVLNVDDAFGAQLAAREAAPGVLVAVSRRQRADVHARRTELTSRGLELTVDSRWGAGILRVPLVGDFNADNALAALAVLLAWEVPFAAAAAALARCTPPPGRMETFGGADGSPLVIVDYAHTPDALDKALLAARAHCRGRLGVVFGCGGDRDAGKRPLMGAVAAARADRILVTDDNPRSEDPVRIVADILRGVPAGTLVEAEHDRAVAIARAVTAAGDGDVVVVAGKGHETDQVVGTRRLPFRDQDAVRAALGRRS